LDSTIYGLIFIAGAALSTYCFVVLIETILGQRKPMSEYLKSAEIPRSRQVYARVVMVWAYFNFSQWLIMWSGNLPKKSRGSFAHQHGWDMSRCL